MAHVDYKQEVVLDAIVNRLLTNVDDMNQRDLTEVLSALAILNHHPLVEAMNAMTQRATELLLEPGMLSATCWYSVCMHLGFRTAWFATCIALVRK